MPTTKEMPSTVKRSSKKAQKTWQETHDSAVQTYGEGERAHRTAFSSLKHSFEKVGDRWVAKKKKGPSDAQAAKKGASARKGGRTKGGVDEKGHTKSELLKRAKKLAIKGRSKMSKGELATALDKANRKATAKSRKKDRAKSRKKK